MDTIITTITPKDIDLATRQAICRITAQGFERPRDEEDPAQIIEHLAGADVVQLASQNDRVVGLAMYGRSLWPTRN